MAVTYRYTQRNTIIFIKNNLVEINIPFLGALEIFFEVSFKVAVLVNIPCARISVENLAEVFQK